MGSKIKLAILALALVGCSANPGKPIVKTSFGADTLSLTTDGPAYIFVGSSSEAREDWVRPLNSDTLLLNRFGMNDSDYGGGVPCAVVWTPNECIALGSLSPVPLDISIPIERKGNTIRIWIDPLAASMPEEFIYKGKGDCFGALREYGKMLAKRGVVPAEAEPWAQESQWCAWGYGLTYTNEEFFGTLPKVAEMGIKWVTLDDGYQVCEGDWSLNPSKYPGGDAQMKEFVDSVHALGFKALLWWCPLAADPGCKFLKENPNSVQMSQDGKPYDITYWDSYYLSPVDPAVIEETKFLVRKFIGEYGFDGFKLDGQHLNCVHPDYNPTHHPEDPYYAFRQLPEYYKLIYNEARAIKPNAVVQFCPCGDVFSVYNFPYINQTVASDPTSSYQVRTKGYLIKALAPTLAYYGDHVELTSTGRDFASQFAVGAVLGTKFTWPLYNKDRGPKSWLTPEKEEIWKRAFEIFETEKQNEGELLGGLYDIAFDYPETYVVGKKDGTLYYSIFSPNFTGDFTLRGLKKGSYKVEDLWTGEEIAVVSAKNPTVALQFTESKLLKVSKL